MSGDGCADVVLMVPGMGAPVEDAFIETVIITVGVGVGSMVALMMVPSG